MKKLFLLIFISSVAFSQVEKKLSVTYVANDGFLLSCDGKNILIDALYNQSFGKYDPPSDDLISKIENGDKPFDKVDLYLVTHNHGDHFYMPYVAGFLEHHKKTLLVSSNEVGDQFRNESKLKDQVKNISLELGASVDTVLNGIPLKIFRLKHLRDTTGTRISNYAFLINMNGVKILHPGDITFEWDESLLEKFNLGKEKIDVLFSPYFDLSETSIKFINEVIKPKHIIAMHIPPKDFQVESKNFLKAFTGGIVFEKPMEMKIIK